MFKVAIIGGAGTNNYPFFASKCIYFLSNKAKSGDGIMIYTTGDDFVEEFAKRCNISTRFFNTDWSTYKNNALKVRNNKMLEDCDALIMFDDGLKDTKVIYDMAKSKNIPCRIVTLQQ